MNVSVRHTLFALDTMPSWYRATWPDLAERLYGLYFDENDTLTNVAETIFFLVDHGFVTPGLTEGQTTLTLSALGRQEVGTLRRGGHAPAYKLTD